MIATPFRNLYRRYGFRRIGIHTFFIIGMCMPLLCIAQHTSREIGFSFAYAGQVPFASSGNGDAKFFSQPLIFNLRYQVATNFVQSLAVVLERVSEERSRTGLWNDFPDMSTGVYNADIAEHLTITTLGIEGIRTLIRTDEFRLGIGVSLGYGFGGATATVKNLTTNTEKTFESCDTWNGFLISTFVRGRFTLLTTNSMDIGLTASARIWGFPSISPLTDCRSSYNGPSLRSVFEIGYLAGISVGFK